MSIQSFNIEGKPRKIVDPKTGQMIDTFSVSWKAKVNGKKYGDYLLLTNDPPFVLIKPAVEMVVESMKLHISRGS